MGVLTFVTYVEGPDDAVAARLLVASLRRFGGDLGRSPVAVHVPRDAGDWAAPLTGEGVEVVPLDVPPSLRTVPFGAAVTACAAAEEARAAPALAWVDPRVVFCRPPGLLDVGDAADVALRPVHVSNIGSPPDAPPDACWRRVYDEAGLDDTALTVESFVDGRRLRAYFNSHVQAVRVSLGLYRRRRRCLERLAADGPFLERLSSAQRLFLFQAAFAALVAATVEPSRIRVLPPDYAYPYNLHTEVPRARRAAVLGDLVCFAWEGRSLRPGEIGDVRLGEPLRTWLAGWTAGAP